MTYNIHIRDEIFGGTVLNLITGKREYVNEQELSDILVYNRFPTNSITKNIDQHHYIKHISIEDSKKIKNGFSFADVAFIELTRACNLKCPHCLNNSGSKQNSQMSFREITELIKELACAGLQEIRFTGGEPLLHQNLYDFIQLTTDLGLYSSLGTNGTLLTEEVALNLKKAGLRKAVVSIDGTQEQHDKIRGTGNYTKSFNALYYLIKNDIDVRINSVLMKSNMKDIIDFAKQVHDKKILLFIRRFIESGRGSSLKNNMLSKKDYDYVRQSLSNELETGGYVNGHYLRNDEGIHPRISLPFKIKACKAGQRALAIMPNGDIHLCGFLAAQNFPAVSNIREIHDWSLFWKNLQASDQLSDLYNNLDKYNSVPGIQTTYCLAYVQNFLNKRQ